MNLAQSIQIIGRFTDTAILSPEISYFTDESKTFIGSLKTDISSQVGFYKEIPNFSRILNLFESPEINIEGTKIKIEEEDSVAYFLSSDTSIIRANSDLNAEEEVNKTLAASPILSIEFDEILIQKLKSASASIDNSRLLIEAKDGKISLIIKDIDVLASDSHSFKIDVSVKSTGSLETLDFVTALDSSITSRMPKGSFVLDVAYSTRVGTYRAVVKQGDLVIVMPMDIVE